MNIYQYNKKLGWQVLTLVCLVLTVWACQTNYFELVPKIPPVTTKEVVTYKVQYILINTICSAFVTSVIFVLSLLSIFVVNFLIWICDFPETWGNKYTLFISSMFWADIHEMCLEKINNIFEPGSTIAFDFDGVIHRYQHGWKDGSIYDVEIPETINLIKDLLNFGYKVFIFSTRDPEQIHQWIENNQRFSLPSVIMPKIEGNKVFWNETGVVGITREKYFAHVYVDDRAFRFTTGIKSLKYKILSSKTVHDEKKN